MDVKSIVSGEMVKVRTTGERSSIMAESGADMSSMMMEP